MIFIKEKKYTITNPKQKLSKEINNILFKDLCTGQIIFFIPDQFDVIEDSKNQKKAYKVGFLFDMLTEIYPTYDKTEKFKIIADRYHFWFTYRQFKNILDQYELNKKSYFK